MSRSEHDFELITRAPWGDRTLTELMGKRTEARYEFLMANAVLADNLDV